jgi:hypothetical protein
MKRYWPWTDLDIDPVNDERAVKRAYSSKLKALDPEIDAAGFIALRSAYDYALSLAKHGNAEYNPDNDYWDEEDQENTENGVDAEAEPNTSIPQMQILSGATENLWSPAPDSDYATEEDQDDEPYKYHPPEFNSDYGVNGSDIAAALQELSALHQGRTPHVNAQAVKAAFEKVVSSPDLENIIIANRLESDLAMMIVNTGNMGFFLAELADFHFGWTAREAQFGLEWPMHAAQQSAEASRFYRHIDKGTPRSERERLYIQALGWLEQGPSNWFTDLGRRKRVMELLETLQDKAPSVYYAMDRDKIEAWENGGASIGDVAWPTANFMLFSTIIMAGWLDINTAATAGVWPMSAIWAVCSFTLLAAILYRKPRLAAVPHFHDPLPVPRREWWAFGTVMLLIPLALLAPPYHWTVILFAAAGGAALSQTTHPNLSKSDGFWEMLAHRRYVIGAFWIAMHAGYGAQSAQYLFLPTAIAAWAITHAHPRFQASLDSWSMTITSFRRWKLHAGILAVSLALLVLIIWQPASPDPDALFTVLPLYTAAAILLVLLHDAITGRYVAVAGMQFYLLRILAGLALLFFPVIALLALIILRTSGILYVAYRDAKTAREHGAQWNDRGDGFDGNSGGFSWGWIGGAILVFTIIRIAVQAS